MTTLYVKIDENGNVVEACPSLIDGGIPVEATDEQIEEIMILRKDAVVLNDEINSTQEGNDYQKKLEYDLYLSSLNQQE